MKRANAAARIAGIVGVDSRVYHRQRAVAKYAAPKAAAPELRRHRIRRQHAIAHRQASSQIENPSAEVALGSRGINGPTVSNRHAGNRNPSGIDQEHAKARRGRRAVSHHRQLVRAGPVNVEVFINDQAIGKRNGRGKRQDEDDAVARIGTRYSLPQRPRAAVIGRGHRSNCFRNRL